MSKVLFSLICRSVSWNKKFSFPHIWARADRLFFSKNYMLRLHVCSKIIIVGYSKTIRTWHDHMNAFVYVRYEKCSTTWSKHFRTDAKYGIYKKMGAYYNSIFCEIYKMLVTFSMLPQIFYHQTFDVGNRASDHEDHVSAHGHCVVVPWNHVSNQVPWNLWTHSVMCHIRVYW